MSFLENEREQNQAYAGRQAFFEDMGVDYLAKIFRDLIKLSDMKIVLLELYDQEKQPLVDALDRNIEEFKKNGRFEK
jgi:hypothetical protein